MITAILILAILTAVLWLAFKCTGLCLSILLWLFIKLPIAMFLWSLGLVFCCTLLLIPIGTAMFRMGGNILFA